MNAILELIKTLIPFGIAFLFLWGIGRICCTNNAKPKQQPDKGSKKEKSGDKKPKSSDEKSNKKNMFDSKNELSSGKQGMMSNKKDLFSSRKSMIGDRDEHVSDLDGILSLPVGKQKKLTSLQKAYLLKEVLDSPKAIKPYRRKYPR